jgi:hypothetical protein
VGIARTRVPTVAEAPKGTVPFFPSAPEKVVLTEEIYRPWTFAINSHGVQGSRVPQRSKEVPAKAAGTTEEKGAPSTSPS